MNKYLHIVTFDNPYPPTYGGAIDVFYRIRELHRQGVKIILHCTYKGKLTKYEELETICEQIYYYKRHRPWLAIFSTLPLAVASRPNYKIVKNLLQDNEPILIEGLVCAGILRYNELSNRRIFFRECNVEHDYYRALAHHTPNIFKRIYYYLEAKRLKRFESILNLTNGILSLAHQDEAHFVNTYPAIQTHYLPCFHANDYLQIPSGVGKYILYHGNLNVPENSAAAHRIIKRIAPLLPQIPFVIAGKHSKSIRHFPHRDNVQFVLNPSQQTMQTLIQEAQIHLLLTEQPTGLKLKLLNVLFCGRHVIVNPAMVCGTELAQVCHQAITDQELASLCRQYIDLPVDMAEKQTREECLKTFDNQLLGAKLKHIIMATD